RVWSRRPAPASERTALDEGDAPVESALAAAGIVVHARRRAEHHRFALRERPGAPVAGRARPRITAAGEAQQRTGHGVGDLLRLLRGPGPRTRLRDVVEHQRDVERME